MASDAGPTAPPADAPLPAGIEDMREVGSPTRRTRRRRRRRLRGQGRGGRPEPAFNADNGYVRYERDANADLFE